MINRALTIIGGGAVAAVVLHRLANAYSDLAARISEIVIFEPSGQIGPGMVYDPGNNGMLLNRTVERMSIIKDKQSDFADWIEETYGALAPDVVQSETATGWRTDFAPRSLFGEYLVARVEVAITRLQGQGIRVLHIREKADTVVCLAPNHFEVASKSHSVVAETVVLATGHGKPISYKHLHQHPQYYDAPFPSARFAALPPNARVGVIGSRLTALDFVLTCVAEDRPDIQAVFLTRSGLLPVAGHSKLSHELSASAKALIDRAYRDPSGWLTLDRMRTELEAEIARATAGDCSQWPPKQDAVKDIDTLMRSIFLAEHGDRRWQAVLAALLEHFNTLWNAVPVQDRTRFKRQYWSEFEAFRVSMPMRTARKLARTMQCGRVRVLNGLQSLNVDQDKFVADFGGSCAATRLPFDAIVNCTGTGDGHASTALFRTMAKDGLTQPDDEGSIGVQFNTNRVQQPGGQASLNLYAIGEIARNSHLVTSSLTVLQVQIDEMLTSIQRSRFATQSVSEFAYVCSRLSAR